MTAAQPGEVLRRGRLEHPRYSAPPFIKLSCAAHVAGAGALIVEPSVWPWVAGGVLLNHGLISVAGLLPCSQLLGENWTRLPGPAIARREVAITLDDGPDPAVTPRVLDLLERHEARASFFVIARHAAAHPALVRAMVERGHSVENHSYRHPAAFSLYGPRRFRAEIERAQQTLTELTGVPPRFFRPPAGLRNVLMYPVLASLGLTHVSWSRRGLDALGRSPGPVVRRLTAGLAAGDILMLHDGNPHGPAPRALVLEVLPRVLARIRDTGMKAVSLTHAAA